MNHPGEIAQLAWIAAPTVALVNNAQREHQEFMDTVEAVARENGAVIEALAADGVAVFPGDDAHTPVWRALAGARAATRFGLDEGADIAAADLARRLWARGAAYARRRGDVASVAGAPQRAQCACRRRLRASHRRAARAPSCRDCEAFAPVKGRMQRQAYWQAARLT